VQEFSKEEMFAGNGVALGGGFDYFFGRLGIGISTGYFTNSSAEKFSSFISNRYLEKFSANPSMLWSTKYILFGPSLKFSFGRFEIDLFAKAGSSQISVPDLLFTKKFYNQTYEVYRFSSTDSDWQFAWSGGTRMLFRINQWLAIQAKADYITTSYLSNIAYSSIYRDVYDVNRNGVMEDTEYFESQKIFNKGISNLNVLNLNMGLIFHLGRSGGDKPVAMFPELPEITPIQVVKVEESEDVKTHEELPIVTQKIEDQPAIQDLSQIPVINEKEAQTGSTPRDADHEAATSEPIVIPPTTYDAPESRYDEEAAEFLYKAGESYFATNDFESALPCFNKLKADPKYPRAKYMFALSLCAMGNCKEAKKEYKEFAINYKESDKRTLEIIFASHFERCVTTGKLKVDNVPASPSVAVPQKEYKIQFIAIKKPDAKFPGLESVGTVSTEYFPNKSVYRYTLVGYQDIREAAEDVYKVRKMGFRDAFVAAYENGIRVNTLYHSK
jgi:tetratricopeptide (TPR) repeat protein